MNEQSILDIISPVMIGPSSSHTAGAVKLGLLAKNIFNDKIKKAKITLYNSYAQTGLGHGCDKGILAGLLGFGVDDIIIKDIFKSAEASKIEYLFDYKESFSRHPNAVDIELKNNSKILIQGQSIGGGEVIVDNINGFNVNINGKYNVIVIVNNDSPGEIAKIASIIHDNNINIASFNCERITKNTCASCCIALDDEINSKILNEIKNAINPSFIRYVKKLN